MSKIDGRSTRWKERREELVKCIESLYQSGINPTVRLIMDQCGGSPNLITKLLRKWRGRESVVAPVGGPIKGTKPWNDGLTKEDAPQLAKPGNGQNFLKNGKPWNYGKHPPSPMKGVSLSESHKESLRGYKPGRFIGKRHWKWSGGRSRKHWRGRDWASIKVRILERDKCCQRCGVESDYWFRGGVKVRKKLSVHHFTPWPIGNNDDENLVTVCISCHMTIEAHEHENQKLKDKVHQKYRYGPDV